MIKKLLTIFGAEQQSQRNASQKRRAQRKVPKSHYEQHREHARKVITQRVAEINEYYQFTYNRIAIRDTKTRWGSCSSKANLNFHYRLLFLPPHLRDYIIIHELCHLKELNHSPAFWALVAEMDPDHKKHRKELKVYAPRGKKLRHDT